MQILFDDTKIAQLINHVATQIAAEAQSGATLALVGIRSRGEILAQRLQQILMQEHGLDLDCGTLDITLYRDDLDQMTYHQPKVRSTEIDFDINGRLIILVDDVLNTGRSIRAALDALVDLGRPQAIRLAVLIDRGQRELPIRPDYVGKEIDAPNDERVHVCLREVDDTEQVVLE